MVKRESAWRQERPAVEEVIAKPLHRVPSMAEIAAIKPNGFRIASLFAGAGGSSLGYRMTGFKVLWASEFIAAAREVYEANAAPGTIVDGRDIREVDPNDVMGALRLAPGDLDVLDGSPPCSSFSTSGRREKGWNKVKKYSDKEQRTDDLFFEYVRFVRVLMPKVFVAENVSGLIKGAAKGYFLEILAALKSCGYAVEARLLDAQWLGVPQARQRVIFVGVREDLCKLGFAPTFPSPFPWRYSVREALGGLSAPIEPETDVSAFAIGKEAGRLSPGEQSTKFFSLVRADWAAPSPTITATGSNLSAASVIYPDGTRKFSIAELKRLCGFPDDFALSGTYGQQYERLGRAVPPVMMAAIAATIYRCVLFPARDLAKIL